MNTSKQASTIESTEIVVEILYIIYAKADLEEVTTNTYKLDANQHEKLLFLIKYF